VDQSLGDAYIAGVTGPSDFPVSNAFNTSLNGPTDAFVSKLDATGSTLLYSTYLGGSSDGGAFAIAADAAGNAYVTGRADSTNFPVFGPLQAAAYVPRVWASVLLVLLALLLVHVRTKREGLYCGPVRSF